MSLRSTVGQRSCYVIMRDGACMHACMHAFGPALPGRTYSKIGTGANWKARQRRGSGGGPGALKRLGCIRGY